MDTLTLERMVHGGAALARRPDGRVALVRGGLPGETVKVALRESSGVLQGEVDEVLEASPDRVPAPLHPGLDYGFVRYERQLELKREVVRDALARALRRDVEPAEIAPPVPSPERWRYRSTVQPVTAAGALGYRRPGSHEVVVLADDPVANEAIAASWRLLAEVPPPKGVVELVMRGNDDGETLLALVAKASPRALVPYANTLVQGGVRGVGYAPFDGRGRFRSGFERLAGARFIRQRYGAVEIEVSAHNFAQPNPAAASGLYRDLATLAPGGRHALDLYAGSGVIAFHLTAAYARVTALEIDRGSVTRGSRDAERLGLTGVRFVKADARRVHIEPDVDLIAVDPPRAGLNREVRELITASATPTLLYVSCDAATWARDAAEFIAGGWRLDTVRPYDFAPHTHHVELLSRFTR